jgi:hypothetical protein
MKNINTKNILLFILVYFLFVQSTLATTYFIENPIPIKASDIKILLANGGKKISLLDLSTIKKTDLEKLTNKKMGFIQSILFKSTQRKIKNSINKDGFITNKKLLKIFVKENDINNSFTGGFLLGFFLSIWGLLLAYLIKDSKQKKRIKYAWIGFAVGTIFFGIAILIILSEFKLNL